MKSLLNGRRAIFAYCMALGLLLQPAMVSSWNGKEPTNSLESEIDARVARIAAKLRGAGIKEIAVRIEGTFEDALRNKALSSILTSFANHAIKIQKNKAEHYLVAEIETQTPKTDVEPEPSYRVSFALKDRNQKVIDPKLDEETIEQSNPFDILGAVGIPAEVPGGKVLDVSSASAMVTGYTDPSTAQVKLKPISTDIDNPSNPGQSFSSPSRPTLGLKPQQDVRDNVAFARKNGLFGVQVLSDGRPVRHFVYQDGLAMVEFKDEKKYEVHVRNDADFDVLFSLQIDGVDSGWFTKDKKVLWFCAAKGTATIPGWLLAGDKEYGTFTIVDEADSVARQSGLSMQVGTIQASFFKAYNSESERDRDPSDLKDGSRSVGTGKGEKFPGKVVRIAKVPGSLRSSVVVRYDRTGK